jgi:hypothetical protein
MDKDNQHRNVPEKKTSSMKMTFRKLWKRQSVDLTPKETAGGLCFKLKQIYHQEIDQGNSTKFALLIKLLQQ